MGGTFFNLVLLGDPHPKRDLGSSCWILTVKWEDKVEVICLLISALNNQESVLGSRCCWLRWAQGTRPWPDLCTEVKRTRPAGQETAGTVKIQDCLGMRSNSWCRAGLAGHVWQVCCSSQQNQAIAIHVCNAGLRLCKEGRV